MGLSGPLIPLREGVGVWQVSTGAHGPEVLLDELALNCFNGIIDGVNRVDVQFPENLGVGEGRRQALEINAVDP